MLQISSCTKMWFGPNITYLSEPWFADFSNQEDLQFLILFITDDDFVRKLKILLVFNVS